MKNKLLVVSLDALQTNDLDELFALPYASNWVKKAAVVRNVREIYPTLTYPIHTTLVTGRTPGAHGIIHNQRASIAPDAPDFSLMGSDWYWHKRHVRVPTLVDAVFESGGTVASVNWPVTAGEKRGYNLPEIWPVKQRNEDARQVYAESSSDNVMQRYYDGFIGRYNWRNNDDVVAYGGEVAIDMLKKESPDLMLYHAVHMDHTRHVYGDGSTQAQDCLRTLDVLVQRLLDACDLDHTNVVILGDHGQVDIDRYVFINHMLRDAGLIQVDAEGKPLSYDAYAFSAGFSAHVYLRDPSDPALLARVEKVLMGLKNSYPEHIEDVFSAQQMAQAEGLYGGFSFVLEGTVGSLFDSKMSDAPYVLPANPMDASKYRAMHGHHPSKGPKPPFIAFGPDVAQGVQLDGVSMLDICPTLCALASVQLPDMEGKALPILRK